MQLINISIILAASLASTVQARHAVEPHLHPRSYDNSTQPSTMTVVVSPIPVTTMPMGTGVSSVDESVSVSMDESMTTKVTNATLTYTMGSGSSTTIITTTIMRTEVLTFTEVCDPLHNSCRAGTDLHLDRLCHPRLWWRIRNRC